MTTTTATPTPAGTTPCTTTSRGWPLERVLFAMAGTVTLVGAVLAATVSPWFLLLTAFVGVNQWLYVTIRGCGASVVLKRVFGLRSALYPSEKTR